MNYCLLVSNQNEGNEFTGTERFPIDSLITFNDDGPLPFRRMQRVTRPRITDLNPYLLCVLCGGYYIDATAIIECLHSFCRSCIVRYLETRKFCPICDVLVHKTKSLQNLRPDTVLQSLVYKLVPNLYEKEMRNRRIYYSKVIASQHPQVAEEKGIITESSKFFSNSDAIDFSLEYVNYSECHFYAAANSRRYFRCPARVTIGHLRRLIELKCSTSSQLQAHFFFNEIQLPEHLTLLDVAYMSAWKRRGSIRILYELQVEKILKEPPSVTPAVEAPPAVPSSASPMPPSSAETAQCTANTETESSTDIVAAPKPTKEPAATPTVTVTTISAPCSNPAPSQNEVATTSSSVSIAANPSSSSVTVKCSLSGDDTTTSSVSTPVTASACAVPVNGLPPSPTNVTPIMSPRAVTAEGETTTTTTTEKSQSEIRVEEGPVNTTEQVPLKSEKSEGVSEKDSAILPPVKRPLQTNETSTPTESSTSVSEMSPKPAKIPKLCGLVEKVLSANKLPGLTIEVQKSVAATTSVPVCSTLTVTTAVSRNVSGSTAVKASGTVVPTSRVDCVQKGSPRPIFNRGEVPTITKSTTKIMKNFTRPWNSAASTNPSSPDVVDANNQSKQTKVIKARPTPSRYPTNRSMYHDSASQLVASSSKSTTAEDGAKKSPASSKIFPVMKIDPQTLSPIIATTANSITPLSQSAPKKSYSPFMPPTSELYSSSGPYTSGGLATYTSPSLTAKPPGSYVMPNPLLPINQLMYEMYGNGTRTIEYMKAMTSNFCPPMFHPSLHPSIGPFYNSMQKKYEKKARLSKGPPSNQSQLSPPSIQRIPPSNNNTKLAISEHSSGEKKQESVSNGQLKHRTKKMEPGISISSSGSSSSSCNSNSNSSGGKSSFSINNLIPLDTEKCTMTTTSTAVPIAHACSADGVHQVCDQMPAKNEKTETEEAKKAATESKLNNSREV